MDATAQAADDLMWERREAWTGLGAFVLLVLAGVLLRTTGDTSTGDEALRFMEDNRGLNYASWAAVVLGGALFVYFLGALRMALRRGSSGAARLAGTMFGGGLLFVAFLWLGWTLVVSVGATFDYQLRGTALDANTLTYVNTLFYSALATAGVAAAVMISAAGVAGELVGLWPKWFLIVSYVVALAAVFSMALVLIPLVLIVFWIGGASWFLIGSYRR